MRGAAAGEGGGGIVLGSSTGFWASGESSKRSIGGAMMLGSEATGEGVLAADVYCGASSRIEVSRPRPKSSCVGAASLPFEVGRLVGVLASFGGVRALGMASATEGSGAGSGVGIGAGDADASTGVGARSTIESWTSKAGEDSLAGLEDRSTMASIFTVAFWRC